MNSSQLKSQLVAEPSTVSHRMQIRAYEISQIIPQLRRHGRVRTVLEVGAGAGWQSKILADNGFKVTAIDIPQSNYKEIQVWPVLDYDGRNIPAEDNSMDAIFSSNVLEHVSSIEEFSREMQRVLKPGGISVHVMPSATWRIWTSVSFYISRVFRVLCSLFGLKVADANAKLEKKFGTSKKRGLVSKLLPARHGERGNVLTETYYFSRPYWTRLFKDTGWSVVEVIPNGVFYSGQRLLGEKLPLETRKTLSNLFGSSCIIYVMKK